MRLRQLDALRGLAAMAVVLHHLVWTRVDTQAHTPNLPDWFWLGFHLLHPAFAGHEAVLLFFVLSGLVLTGAVVRRERLAYPGYLMHRVARIYVPYLAAILLAIAACYWFRGRIPAWTPWTAGAWQIGPNATSMAQHVLFLGTYPLYFNNVIWSLIMELRISIVFPFLVYGLRRLGLRWGVVVVGVLGLADAVVAPLAGAHLSPGLADLYRTAHFGIFFALGAMLALHAEAIGRVYLRLGPAARIALGLTSFLALGYFDAILNVRLPHLEVDLVGALGAAGLLACAMHDRWLARVLDRKPLLWLGDISYSLYLLHLPVIMVLIALWGGIVPYLLLALLAVVCSLAVARLFWALVEVPSRALGKALDRRYLASVTRVNAPVARGGIN